MTGAGPSRETHRFDYLDGLRGLAAAVVVLHHFLLAFVATTDDPPLLIAFSGHFSVGIFFVMSGFVLAHTSAKGKSTLPARLVTRYLRLTVPMLASILFAFILLHLFTASRTQLQAANPTLWVTQFTYGAEVPGLVHALQDGLYRVFRGDLCLYNNVLWTMKVELIGSIAIYFIYRFCPERLRMPVLLMLIVPLMFKPDYLGFLFGAWGREAWVRHWFRDSRWSWLAAAASLPLACLGVIHGLFFTLGAAALVYAVFTLATLRDFLSTRLLRFLGRISFALYLIHLPLIFSVGAWLYFHLASPGRLVLTFTGVLAVSLVTAYVMTRLVDEPLMSGLRKIRKLR